MIWYLGVSNRYAYSFGKYFTKYVNIPNGISNFHVSNSTE